MNRKAFSLIEVLVSLVILMIGIMGLATTFQRNIYQTNSAKNDSQALMIASGLLDELESSTFRTEADLTAEIPNIIEEFLFNYYGQAVASGDEYYAPAITIIDTESYTHETTDIDGNPITEEILTAVVVEITVNWKGWNAELKSGGYGMDTATNAFTMTARIGRQYGEDLLAGDFGSGGGAP
jgi:type II secretory pathway pseudopilin PulG